MNPIEAVVRKVDQVQQHNRIAGFVFGVIKKFGDDNGGALVSNMAYAGFVSLFPLLLILATILGLVASADPAIQHEALQAVAKQVPVMSAQLTGNVHQLRRSSIIGLITGTAVLIWGTTRLAQAGIFTMQQVWNLPGPARVGYFPRLGRAALFMGVLGLGLLATTLLAALTSFEHHAVLVTIVAEVLAAVANAGIYLLGFRVLTPKAIELRRLVPGAIAGGVAWTVLQKLGTILVHHSLRTAAVYGIFATVLALLAWVYLGVEVTVYAAELNTVLAWRLWPRAMVQPPLTEADRASMALQALQNQRRPEQQVEVTYNDRPPGVQAPATTPQFPEDVVPFGGGGHAHQQVARDQAPDEQAAPEPAARQNAPVQPDHE